MEDLQGGGSQFRVPSQEYALLFSGVWSPKGSDAQFEVREPQELDPGRHGQEPEAQEPS